MSYLGCLGETLSNRRKEKDRQRRPWPDPTGPADAGEQPKRTTPVILPPAKNFLRKKDLTPVPFLEHVYFYGTNGKPRKNYQS